jgi:hypothetical protein
MRTFVRSLAIIGAAVFLVFSTTLLGQETPREELRDKVETVIIGKFAESLDLTPGQAEKFFPRLRAYNRSMEDMQREQRDLRERLDKLSETEDSSPEEVSQLLDQLSENQEHMVAMKRGFLHDLSPFMSPQQVSRCSILMDEIPQRVREMIRERQGHRGVSPAPPVRRAPPRGGRRR